MLAARRHKRGKQLELLRAGGLSNIPSEPKRKRETLNLETLEPFPAFLGQRAFISPQAAIVAKAWAGG
jgi:hypothetical protein